MIVNLLNMVSSLKNYYNLLSSNRVWGIYVDHWPFFYFADAPEIFFKEMLDEVTLCNDVKDSCVSDKFQTTSLLQGNESGFSFKHNTCLEGAFVVYID